MKKLMLITAPVSSRSGYGDHARDLVRSVIDQNKYEIKIVIIPDKKILKISLIFIFNFWLIKFFLQAY